MVYNEHWTEVSATAGVQDSSRSTKISAVSVGVVYKHTSSPLSIHTKTPPPLPIEFNYSVLLNKQTAHEMTCHQPTTPSDESRAHG